MTPGDRFDTLKILDDFEVSLLRQALARTGLVSDRDESSLRLAIAVARLRVIEDEAGTLLVEDLTAKLRAEVETLLGPQLGPGRLANPASLGAMAPLLRAQAQKARAEIVRQAEGRIDPRAVDREIREKALVLVTGGGGGTGYVHLGAFQLLEELGIRPSLIVGTSMGAVMGLFRARKESFDPGEMVSVLRSISYRKVFRLLSTENRYGLPAALRLYLRAAIGRHFMNANAAPLRLNELRIPLIVTVTGIRRGMLPHPPEFYEGLIKLRDLRLFSPRILRQRLMAAFSAIVEIAQLPNLEHLHLGADPETLEFDALDAVGFSCALPGVIHYDVLRDDPRMRQMLDALLARHDVFRLVDGGITDNVPAHAAWRAVQLGRIGRRNALILALDGFAPKIHTPLWLALQRFADRNVEPNLRFAHLVHRFSRTLSPLELVPSVDDMLRISRQSREEIEHLAPLIRRLMNPLPAFEPV